MEKTNENPAQSVREEEGYVAIWIGSDRWRGKAIRETASRYGRTVSRSDLNDCTISATELAAWTLAHDFIHKQYGYDGKLQEHEKDFIVRYVTRKTVITTEIQTVGFKL